MFRYGINHQLNFVLPTVSGGNHLNSPHGEASILTNGPFKTEWLDEQSGEIPWHKTFKKENKYDIFNLHTIWNKTAVRYLIC